MTDGNVAFDDGGTAQLDPASMDRTLDLSTDEQILGNHVALDALIKMFSACNSPSTWPNTFSVPSPEILPTTVMPRLMVETWSADPCPAGFVAAGRCGCCVVAGRRSLSSLDFPNIARSLFCIALVQDFQVA
jgi:hypothetical protein